jgi:radical SAM protein with 4Fe4S-binding SPASM domain
MKCHFCPTQTEQKRILSLEDFENINIQLSRVTKEVYYHIMGDPLVLSNLKDYLDISQKYNLKVNITTTGVYGNFDILHHNIIRQINFSINSINGTDIDFDSYMDIILIFCNIVEKSIFVNLRLWNSFDYNFNSKVINYIEKFFSVNLNSLKNNKILVKNRVIINFAEYFEWPSLDNSDCGDRGYCYGLKSHFGILSNGNVVPCCLDRDGVIILGNIFNNSIEDILNSSRAKNIIGGFKNRVAIEELCKKCSYKNKF